MLENVHPKLPMRNKLISQEFYVNKLQFEIFGNSDLDFYLMLEKDKIQIHLFEFKELNIFENYGQIYIRTKNIETIYENFISNGVNIHPNGKLESKPWGQKEFSLLDPDHNLITFGQTEL